MGAGTAGRFAWRAASEAGARAVLIEEGPGGTTCVRCGCIPSKLLLLAADAARRARGAARFGVFTGEVRVDGRAVMRRLHEVRAHFLRSVAESLETIPAEARLQGRARFTAPGVLAVGDGLEVRARAVVIATGARPLVAKPLEPVRDLVMTHEEVFDLDDLPASLAVVGAGAVGIELAVAFARLGVRTTVFDKGDTIGGLKDPEVCRVARELLGAEVELKLGVEVETRPDPDGARLLWRDADGRAQEAVFARVLAAAGRVPAVDALDLPRAGLALDEHGTPRFDPATLRCGDAPVFMAGDVGVARPVLHEAHDEGETAGRAAALLASGRPAPPRPDTPLYGVTFTDPDMASVGESLEALGEDAVVGSSAYDEGRASLEGEAPGLIRLYARRGAGCVAGAEMVGPAVEHLSHLVAGWVQERTPVARLLEHAFYHPTYEEDLLAALRSLDGASREPPTASPD